MAEGWVSPKTDISTEIVDQLNEMEDHRSYFTYWITSIQVIICILTLVVFERAPFGITQNEHENIDQGKLFSPVTTTIKEEMNFWIGPRRTDLIKVGAKYAPCIRPDKKLDACNINYNLRAFKSTGCCEDQMTTTSDGYTPCAYLGREQCPNRKFYENTLCCDIKNTSDSCNSDQIIFRPKCQVIGRPCCVGSEGKCIIDTETYCQIRNGIYHEDKTHCSEVNCQEDSCGLLPFVNKPDQIYRIFFSLFVHYGVVHCLITVVFQLTL